MTASEWQQLRQLFDEAMALPADQRTAYVAEQQQRHPALAGELQQLLEADAENDTLGESIQALNQEFQADYDQRFIGNRIGPYELTELIGSGGMGLVYKAVRVSGDFDQQVAIKLLRQADAHLIRRNLIERQALSTLNHPNIAKIFDAGMTAAGMPYLVMEYIQGDSLGDYLQQHTPALQRLLELFIQICQAVDYSHRNLILHRDLKPSNVMVDADGRPRLIDYGIAKQLRPGKEAERTLTMEYAWSPNYASPEQVRGEALTTTSDIYALGLLLFRMLTGEDAQPVRQLSIDQAIKRICEQSLPNPTKAGVPADLARVILKAAHKDPQQRYASARELADDVQRFIQGQPVLAVGDSFYYHLRKWIGRHRLATAATLVSVLLLGVAVQQIVRQRNAALASQARALTAEADSQIQLARANEVSEFLVEIFNAANVRQNAGQEITARALLDRALQDIENRQQLEPDLKIELLRTIARAYTNTGLEEQAHIALDQALAIWRGMPDGDVLQRAAILNDIGNAYMRVDRAEEAQPLLQEALAIRRAELPAAHADIAHTLNNLASNLINLERLEEARDALLEARRLMEADAGTAPLSLSAIYNNLARLEERAGEYRQALEYINQSLTIKRDVHGEAVVPYADSLVVRAQINRRLHDWPQVGRDLEQSMAIIREQLTADSWRYYRSLGELANYYHDLGQFEKAESYYQQELAHPLASRQPEKRAITVNNLAALYEDTQQYERALPLYRQSRDLRREHYGADSYRYSTACHNLGRLLVLLQRYDEAAPLLAEAAEIRAPLVAEDHPGRISLQLDQIRLDSGRGGCEHCGGRLQALRQMMSDGDHQHAGNWIKLNEVQAEYWQQQGDNERARTFWNEAYQRRRDAFGAEHPLTLRVQAMLQP